MRSRDTIPLTSLVVLALVPVLLLGGAWQFAEANVPPPTTTTTTTMPPPPVDELRTGLFSYRRHPTPLAERAAEAERAEQEAHLADDLVADVDASSCVAITRDGVPIVDVDPRTADGGVIPASNMKLVVAAAALEVLGPDHRFRTELRSLPPVDTVVPGDVYLIGGGDPVLVTADHVDPLRYPAVNTTVLDALADQLATVGVTRIDGDVIGDGTRYDDEFRVPTWGDGITNVDAGPYDALLVNDGLIGPGDYGLVPAQSAATIMFRLIEERGIDVVGSRRHDATPDDPALTTLAIIESEPLTEILVELLHTSDNNTAELLVKEIGFARRGEGTRAAGLAVINEVLLSWGVSIEHVVLDDGSGLSRLNRLTCDALVAVLDAAPPELLGVLPVAGRDGTLAEQFIGTPAEGELVAKTGTLTDVKALTGVLDGGDDEPIEFALVLNGDGVDDPATYLPVWLELVDTIGRYPVVVEPEPDRFAPR